MKKITFTRNGIDLEIEITEELKNSTDDDYVAFIEDAILVLQNALLDKQCLFE